MSRHTVPAGLLGGIVGLTLTVATAGMAFAAPTLRPSLKATPQSVMVNTDTTITGKSFAPGVSVRLTECSVTNWVVPSDPCTTANTVTVTPNKRGTFETAFKAALCPGGKQGTEPTSEICYVGITRPSGIDTVGLALYVKVIVTYP